MVCVCGNILLCVHVTLCVCATYVCCVLCSKRDGSSELGVPESLTTAGAGLTPD